ncbi:MAG: S4 domain-containing protein, partial [Pseudomonadota bacterium]
MRLDLYLVEHGFADSRARAQAMIAAGQVTVDGAPANKAAQKVQPNARIEATGALKWVSRAALKLEHALDVFALTPSGDALDIGASTGGFTEVLLAQ